MKKLLGLLSIVMILSMVLSACVSQVTPTPEPVAPVEEPTAPVEPTAAPVEEVEEVEEVVEEPELGPVLKIGQIGMMSGAMALYGLQQQRGFEMGLEYMSGGKTDDQGRYIIANRPVEVIVKDDEGNPEKAVSLALELIERDGVELLQGPVSSASAIALTNVALENEIILMIDPAASYFTTGAYFNPYVFRTARTSFDDTLIIAKYLVENVGPTFAHIGVDNAFGQGSGAAL
jgi:branched-chain amino acid transport system substrate-binding protein